MSESDSQCRILVMASGSGSNFQALIDGIAGGEIPNSRIIRLITNRAKAFASTRADNAGIPRECFNLVTNGFLKKGETDEPTKTAGRSKYDASLAQKVLALSERPELIVLAGWMHVFTPSFLDPISKAGIKVINLHPALPGEFDGAHAIERAHEALVAGRIERTGIMVHYVIAAVDRGDPILTQEIKWAGEDLEKFEEKIHGFEHGLIVRATAKVAGEIVSGRAA